MNDAMTTTAFGLEGFRIRRSLGVVRGITVRSRSLVGTLAARSRPSSGATSRSSPSCARRRGAKLRHDAPARRGARRQRGHRRPLRCDRAAAERHRGHLLRHGGRRRTGLIATRSPLAPPAASVDPRHSTRSCTHHLPPHEPRGSGSRRARGCCSRVKLCCGFSSDIRAGLGSQQPDCGRGQGPAVRARCGEGMACSNSRFTAPRAPPAAA